MNAGTKKIIRILVCILLLTASGLLSVITIISSFAFLHDDGETAGFTFVAGLFFAWLTVIWSYEIHRARQEKKYVLLSGLMMSFWVMILMLGFAYFPLHMPAAAGVFLFLAFSALGIIVALWFSIRNRKSGRFVPGVTFLNGQPVSSLTGWGIYPPVDERFTARTQAPGAFPAAPGFPQSDLQEVGTMEWKKAGATLRVFAEPGVSTDYVQLCADHLAGLSEDFLRELAERIYLEMNIPAYEAMIGTDEISRDKLSLIFLSCPDRINIFRPKGFEPAFTIGGEPVFEHEKGMAWSLLGHRLLKVGPRYAAELYSPWEEGQQNSML